MCNQHFWYLSVLINLLFTDIPFHLILILSTLPFCLYHHGFLFYISTHVSLFFNHLFHFLFHYSPRLPYSLLHLYTMSRLYNNIVIYIFFITYRKNIYYIHCCSLHSEILHRSSPCTIYSSSYLYLYIISNRAQRFTYNQPFTDIIVILFILVFSLPFIVILVQYRTYTYTNYNMRYTLIYVLLPFYLILTCFKNEKKKNTFQF